MEAKKIIFDTDIGWDCDDAGALALIHSLCNKGEAELLAVTATYYHKYVAGCIDAINRFYGRIVPVGVNYARRDTFVEEDHPENTYVGYAKPICEEFANSYKDGKAEDSIKLMRKTLANEADNSVTIVATGTQTCLAQLLKSEADDISELSGVELIKKKVERTVVMGGRFKNTWPMPIVERGVGELVAEYNIKGDIPSAKFVCDNWPGELVFSSYEIGNYCITLKNVKYDEKAPNPVAYAYKLFGFSKGRESWDLTAALHGIRPEHDYYYLHEFGKVNVSDEGVTTWEKSDNFRQSYLLPCKDYSFVVNDIESIIESELPIK
ncbi:MAG: nucleoside hydrolase [Firmicutes bacterium]|nr:nucleoside hydrolase [Bacillota bacterium]